MSFRLVIRPAAHADIIEAASWYEEQQSGVGNDFSNTSRTAIRALAEAPLTHAIRIRRKSVRWFVAPRFPYKIIYRIEGDAVVVFAVIHTARHDRAWLRRL
jgi:toxin ParE1/3/4